MYNIMTSTSINLNIAPSSIAGKCVSKCDYSFNYPTINITATNGEMYILSTLPVTSSPPVSFNETKYMASEFSIICPSIHLFNGTPASGEIIISHTPITGGPDLIVCIPLSVSGATSNGSKIINQIVAAVSTGAPKTGDNTSQGIDEFSLNDIVPMTPYYSYSNENEFIVYGINNAIGISQTTLKSMQSILQPYVFGQFFAITSLFTNPNGPTSSTSIGDGQIYISCQPTGDSEEKVDIIKNKTPEVEPINLTGIFDLLIYLFYVIVCICLIIAINKGFQYINGEKIPLRKPK
jgi:hypothetical protein